MKTALAIRHLHFEDLGLLADSLAAAGYHVEYREAGVEPLSTRDAVNADLLVVLDHGNIVEMGTHEELTERRGLYYFLSTQQLNL